MNPLRRRCLAVAVALALLLPATRAAAEWASLGAMPAPRRERSALVFRNAQGTVAVSALTPSVVRVRFAPSPNLGRDHSYAILSPPAGDTSAQMEVGAAASILRTSALRVTLAHAPFRVAFASADGQSLDEDDPARGIAFSGRASRGCGSGCATTNTSTAWARRRADLDKRGRYRGGYAYTMWNCDTFAYGDDTDPHLRLRPLLHRDAQGPRPRDLPRQHLPHHLRHRPRGRRISSPSAPRTASSTTTSSTGPRPRTSSSATRSSPAARRCPRCWALGYHQCRYSYYPEVEGARTSPTPSASSAIPADVIWLDIHYLEGYNPFTWDRERFPDPARMIRDLRGQGFRVVTIVDPHPKKQPGWSVYDSGLAGGPLREEPRRLRPQGAGVALAGGEAARA